jgi:transcriptional repressor NrdR
MRCPYCLGDNTKVLDKRDVEGFVRRRRGCLKCEKRFNTHEKLERVEFKVLKKDGRREPFDFNKIKKGVVTACEKRPISSENIDKMLTNVEGRLRKRGKEIKSGLIGDMVSRELKKMDKVAYIRFASVYKDFTELKDFKREIREISG